MGSRNRVSKFSGALLVSQQRTSYPRLEDGRAFRWLVKSLAAIAIQETELSVGSILEGQDHGNGRGWDCVFPLQLTDEVVVHVQRWPDVLSAFVVSLSCSETRPACYKIQGGQDHSFTINYIIQLWAY